VGGIREGGKRGDEIEDTFNVEKGNGKKKKKLEGVICRKGEKQGEGGG